MPVHPEHPVDPEDEAGRGRALITARLRSLVDDAAALGISPLDLVVSLILPDAHPPGPDTGATDRRGPGKR
ncbi:hypothetical protein [Actinosynnema sp. NPDC023587]|uniref:hypothetical protein n=1 Tax=Actinosynnema sp. NPDC023587 TaxID=3154695 RepID=UPI0033DCED4B